MNFHKKKYKINFSLFLVIFIISILGGSLKVTAFDYKTNQDGIFGNWGVHGQNLNSLNNPGSLSSFNNVIGVNDFGNSRILFINQTNFKPIKALYNLTLSNGTIIPIKYPGSLSIRSNNSFYYYDSYYELLFLVNFNGTVLSSIKGNIESVVYFNNIVFILAKDSKSHANILSTDSNLQNEQCFLNSTQQNKFLFIQAISRTSLNTLAVLYGEISWQNNQWTNENWHIQFYTANDLVSSDPNRIINLPESDNVTGLWDPMDVFSFDLYDNNTLILPDTYNVYIFSTNGELLGVMSQISNNWKLSEPLSVIVNPISHNFIIDDSVENVIISFSFTDLSPSTFSSNTISSTSPPSSPFHELIPFIVFSLVLLIVFILGTAFFIEKKEKNKNG